MRAGEEAQAWLLGFSGVAIFSLSLPMTRLAVAELPPIFVGPGRAVVAAFPAAILLWLTRQRWPRGREWLGLAVVSLGVVLGFPLLSAWAMQRVEASHGAVVLGILPLATAVFGALLAAERPSPGFWLVAAVGSTLVVIFALDDAGTLAWADLALLAAVFSAGLGYAEGARLSRALGGWQVISWALVLAAPFLAVPVGLAVPDVDWGALSWRTWAAFAYVSLFAQYIGFFAWYRGLALGGIAKIGQVQLLQAFLTIGFAALLNGEAIGWRTIVFAVAVVGCVAIGRRQKVRRLTSPLPNAGEGGERAQRARGEGGR
ncbi:MAG TPA: DMT family transporter [Kiloniellales bacterium]|nr:DMT family transporter [Kiloniellales bacterium]